MTKRTAYIANVGTRDIQRGGKLLRPARAEGAGVLANYDAQRAELTAPILVPGLREAAKSAGRIDRVVLFATDQPSTATSYWENDTIELGRILKRFLKEELGDLVGEVECRPIPHNPADHEKALAFYRSQLPDLVPPDDFETVWIAPVGGPDACNVGLTLNATRLYRHRCQFIYVFEGGRVQILDLHREILNGQAREAAAAHLAHRDFVPLREVLVQAELGKRWQHALCTYADARLRFDFAGAEAALEDALISADGGQARGRIARCRTSLEPFLREPPLVPPTSTTTAPGEWDAWLALQRASLAELYFNLGITVRREAWVDFLGRLFRLNEAALRLAFEDATRHSAEEDQFKYPDFEKVIAADSRLLDFFKQNKVNAKRADTRGLRTWVAYRASVNGARYQALFAHFDRIAKLSTLRNKSILAHGYQSVRRAGIETELGGQTVTDFVERDLRDLLTELGAVVTPDADPLRDVVAWLEDI